LPPFPGPKITRIGRDVSSSHGRKGIFNPFTEVAADDTTDAALVERAKNGDRSTLEKLVSGIRADRPHSESNLVLK
jgi:hypothetical protein